MKKKCLILLSMLLFNLTLANASLTPYSLNVNMTGTVSISCTFSINSVQATTGATPSAASVGLNFLTVQESPPNGAVVMNCNDYNGYTLSAASLNNGLLVSGSHSIAYQLDLASQVPILLTSSPQPVLVKNILTSPEVAQNYPLRITYPLGVPNVVSGSYSDVVTFTLIGN